MARGYFPMSRESETGKELLSIVARLQEIQDVHELMLVSLDQHDNCYYDGVAMGAFNIATGLLAGLVMSEKSVSP